MARHKALSLVMAAAGAPLVLLLSSCGVAANKHSSTATPSGQRLSGKLELTGSSTIAPVMAEIAKRFEKQHPDVRINVQTGGSSRGVADPQKELADIGMASRALKADELNAVQSHLLALDGVCLIIHKSNAISTLTDKQIAAIYTGKLANWSDASGKDAPITVVNKAEGRSTLELFLTHFNLKSHAIKASVVIGDNEQGIKTVAGNPDSIGYVSIGSAEYAAAHGVPIKLLPMNGIAASVENVRNGTFPLSRPLHLVTLPGPTGLKKTFLDFALSKDVHDLIKELNFVPIE